MKKKKISIIMGTRPEAIKLIPIVKEIEKHAQLTVEVCVTAQHRQMLDQVLTVFNCRPDVDLDLMQDGQSLSGLTARAITALDDYLKKSRPDMVVVQGDTTTTYCGALTAFYNSIPVAHVEAGLRTFDLLHPFPEEANRQMTSRLSQFHFAPTQIAANNLIREGISEKNIHIVGNTVIDALFMAKELISKKVPEIPGLSFELQDELKNDPSKQIVLITGHRRENFGEGFKSFCRAIAHLADQHPHVHFIYPVHLNPNVQEPVNSILKPKINSNIHLIKPLPYLPFVSLMLQSHHIISDSGGIQEEAPSIGKPVIVTRTTTERPEVVEAGAAILVGTDLNKITKISNMLLTNKEKYNEIAQPRNIFGDGKSSRLITKQINSYFK